MSGKREFKPTHPTWHIWACLKCGQQSRGPTGHHDDGRTCTCGQALAKIDVRVNDSGIAAQLWRAHREHEEQQHERLLAFDRQAGGVEHG